MKGSTPKTERPDEPDHILSGRPLQFQATCGPVKQQQPTKRMKNTLKPRTSASKEPTPVTADVGQRKPSGGLNPQEPAGSNEQHHSHQVKQSSVESDRLEGQRDQSAHNGPVTGRARTTEHRVHAFRARLLTTVALALTILLLVGPTSAAQFDQCEIVVADSWGTIYLFSPRTGDRVIISQWGELDRPYKMIRDRKGNILVSDTGTLSIVLINSATREQTVIAKAPQLLGVPLGLDVDEHNRLFVVNGVKLLSIDLDSHEIETVAEGGFLQAPLDVVVAPGGVLIIADALAGIIRIDPVTRQQTLISRGGFLRTPLGLALDNNNRTLYVADAGGSCVVAIDLHDNSQRMVSQGGLLTTPVAVALGPGGTILVSDPDSGSNLDGAIIAIDRDGRQTRVMQGFGDLINPRGLLIVVGHF